MQLTVPQVRNHGGHSGAVLGAFGATLVELPEF